jgi:hypothetical protein
MYGKHHSSDPAVYPVPQPTISRVITKIETTLLEILRPAVPYSATNPAKHL